MNATEIQALAAQVLARIAPEADLASVDPREDLRNALDLDSMDFLNFITGLSQGSGRAIPEKDYPHFFTLDGVLSYLAAPAQS